MRRNFTLSILFLFIGNLSFSQNYIWTQKANFPGAARYEAAAFAIGNKGYFCTGANFALNTVYNDLWQYNQATNVWTQKANLPGSARFGAAGFTIGQKGYVATGWTLGGLQLMDLWQYNPSTNAWAQKANFGGSARYDAFAAGVGNSAYLGFGYAPLQNDWWKYNSTTNAWTQRASFPGTARQSVAGFVINSKIYLGTGHDGTNKTDFWEYNPASNVWVQKAGFTGSARYAAVGFAINGFGYIGTGGNNTASFNTFKRYDPATNTWSGIANMPGSVRHAADGFTIGLRGYIGLGRNSSNSYFNDFWEYGPEPLLVTISTVNISCNGLGNGTAGAVVSGGTGPYNFLWSTGQTTSTINGLLPGVYTVTATDASGTTGSASAVITEPAALTILPTTPVTLCKGSTANLSVTASGGTPPYQLVWDNGAFTGPVYTVSPAVSTTYSVYVMDANGCVSPTSQIAVNVINLPSATISSPNGTFACYPDSLKLTTPNTAGYTYRWKFNGALISGAIDYFYYADKTGAYKVVVTNAQGCSKTSADKNITVQNINPTISPAGTVTMCQGSSTLLKASPNPGYNYQWKKNAVNIPGATVFSYSANTAGVYKVKVTDPVTGCTALSPGTNIVVNCREEDNHYVAFIYPNPGSFEFTFDFSSMKNEPVSVAIFDLSGRKMKELTVKGNREKLVTGSDLPPGAYYAKVVQAGFEKVYPLLKVD